jgi:hypothetical protein
MKIFIRDEPFEIYDYDDITTVMDRYALSKNALPSYYHVINPDIPLEEGTKIIIEDIREILKNTPEVKLKNREFIDSIILKYTLTPRDIGLLWINANGLSAKPKVDMEVFGSLDKYMFSSPARIEELVVEYKKEVERDKKTLKEEVEKSQVIYKKLNNIPSVDVSPFQLEDITREMRLVLPNKENLIEVFNGMTATAIIPFIYLRYDKKDYYKIYKYFAPHLPMGWVEFDARSMEDIIYFKVLNVKTYQPHKANIDSYYSTAVWASNNLIEIKFPLRAGISEEIIQQRILSNFSENIRYQLVQSKQSSVRGTFTVANQSLSRPIFVDMIFNNKTFSQFLYTNESAVTSLYKINLFVYFSPSGERNISKSLGLTITPQISDKENYVNIRVSRAQNITQAMRSIRVFSKLFALYNQEYKKVYDAYNALIPDFPKILTAYEKTEKVKEELKTKHRAQELHSKRPDLFTNRYYEQCQRPQQPYILDNQQDAEALAKEIGEHKVMFFESTWFACDPREPDDPDKAHVWPGLIENKLQANKEKFPYVPCCFKEDHYLKKASLLRKYLDKGGLLKGPKEEDEEMPGLTTYIKGANKLLEPGRYGKLPYNWEKILNILNVQKMKKKKIEYFPYLLKGVIKSADSFLHCLETAFNVRYRGLSPVEKRQRVMDVRKEMSIMPLTSAKQELYALTPEMLEAFAEDPTFYVDPNMFVGLAQKYYKCNIFLYAITRDSPLGEIVIPTHSTAYLFRDIDQNKPSVFIFKFDTKIKGVDYPLPDIPFQSELLSKVDVKNEKYIGETYDITGGALVEMAIKLLYDSNQVYIIEPSGVELYHPVPE